MNEYIKQAEDFLRNTNTILTSRFIKCDDCCDWDKGNFHNLYKVTIRRTADGTTEKMSFNFWDSRHNTINNIKPSTYDFLACIEKYDPEDYENFCSEYGYEMFDDFGRRNKKSYKTFLAVQKQWNDVERVFSNVLDELREIC